MLFRSPHVVTVGGTAGASGVVGPAALLCLWRTEVGRLAASYSRDGGETWDAPGWLTHEGTLDGATPLRNPRGAITPHRLRAPGPDGLARYVLLYYNHGRTERLGYVGRRVAWLVPGRATPAGLVEWGQPEVALWWDGTGLWCATKRLEKGSYTWPGGEGASVGFRPEQLSALITGLEVREKAGWYRC